MSSTWNGSALLARFAHKYGFVDTTSQARVLEWMNEIQRDIADKKNLPVFKFKMKKLIPQGAFEVDLAPQIPSAPTIALLTGGSLTADAAVSIKVTFVLFDSEGREVQSLESEASAASNSVTPTGTDLSLTVTGLSVYNGASSVQPTIIHRRIYLKIGAADYFLAKTVEDNTATTTTITSYTASLIEPPEGCLVKCLADDAITIEGSGYYLSDTSIDAVNAYDPNNTSTGTPNYTARVSETRIRIYPRPSSALTLSYWVYRYPSRIFSDTSRVMQLPERFRTVLDAGVHWKGTDHKDNEMQSERYQKYEMLLLDKINMSSGNNGKFQTITRVC